jgi:hypothetical protein
MNINVLKVAAFLIIVLIIIAGYANKSEAVQDPVDIQLPGEPTPATVNKRNTDKNSKWGYCYDPEMTMHYSTQLKDNEYRAYQCANESGWTGYFEIYYKSKKIYTERVKNGHFSICDPNDSLDDCSNMPAGKDINGDGIPGHPLIQSKIIADWC